MWGAVVVTLFGTACSMMNWPRTLIRRPTLVRRQTSFDPNASIEDLREHIAQFWGGLGPAPKGVYVPPVLISSIRGELGVPARATGRRAILYIHRRAVI